MVAMKQQMTLPSDVTTVNNNNAYSNALPQLANANVIQISHHSPKNYQ